MNLPSNVNIDFNNPITQNPKHPGLDKFLSGVGDLLAGDRKSGRPGLAAMIAREFPGVNTNVFAFAVTMLANDKKA